MAQWVRTSAKLMLMRNCIQIPDIHEKSGGGGRGSPVCLQSQHWGVETGKDPGSLLAAILTETVSFCFSERPCLKGTRQKSGEGKTLHPPLGGSTGTRAPAVTCPLHTSHTTYEGSHTKRTTIPSLQFFRNITAPGSIPTSVYRDAKLISKSFCISQV